MSRCIQALMCNRLMEEACDLSTSFPEFQVGPVPSCCDRCSPPLTIFLFCLMLCDYYCTYFIPVVSKLHQRPLETLGRLATPSRPLTERKQLRPKSHLQFILIHSFLSQFSSTLILNPSRPVLAVCRSKYPIEFSRIGPPPIIRVPDNFGPS
ncbi:hypothetical protein F5884DRAFT_21948 [Xylogone sp. PMI_703]|nr:hypothetical protein F5884DRAFT_21948 [Xylogone sp. PMI_703]